MIINIFLKRSDTKAYPSYQAQAVHHDHHQQLSALKSKNKYTDTWGCNCDFFYINLMVLTWQKVRALLWCYLYKHISFNDNTSLGSELDGFTTIKGVLWLKMLVKIRFCVLTYSIWRMNKRRELMVTYGDKCEKIQNINLSLNMGILNNKKRLL